MLHRGTWRGCAIQFQCETSGRNLLVFFCSFPDHNSAHAADVLHGVYYFTTQRIAGFCPFDSSDRNSDSDSVSGEQSEEATEWVDQYDRLTSCIPDLERFALYSAAAMHDYDHPGRTNAFVVATLEPQVHMSFCFIVYPALIICFFYPR